MVYRRRFLRRPIPRYTRPAGYGRRSYRRFY